MTSLINKALKIVELYFKRPTYALKIFYLTFKYCLLIIFQTWMRPCHTAIKFE